MTEKRFKVVDNYTISYDGDYFDLHKPSNIRSLVNVANYVINENEQLKTQIKIFELFLKENDLDIEWYNFCTIQGECPITDEMHEELGIDCKNCIHLGYGDD